MKRLLFMALAIVLATACKDDIPEAADGLYQVTSVTATAGDGQALVEWVASTERTPNQFYLTWTANDTDSTSGDVYVEATESDYTFSPLTNDVSYTFTVQASYDEGLSGIKSATCTPKSSRYPVTGLIVESAGENQIRLTWSKPASDLVLSYRVECTSNDDIADVTVSDPNTLTTTVTTLEDEVKYTFAVYAVYATGDSVAVSGSGASGTILAITVAKTTLVVTEPLTFSYNDLYFNDGDVASVLWNFGDGTTSTETSPTHSFDAIDDYTVKVTVTYSGGGTDNGEMAFEVTDYLWSEIALDNDVKVSAPVFSNDGLTMYISSIATTVYSIDLYSGEINWKQSTGSASYGGGPVVGANDYIYQGDNSDFMFAYDKTGALKWSYETEGGDIKSFPAVTSDNVLYCITNSPVILYALNGNTGEKLWDYAFADASVGSAVMVDADGNVYAGTDVRIYSITSSGTLRWLSDVAYNVTECGSFAASPDGTVLYASLKSGSGVVALNMSDGTTKWQKDQPAGSYDTYAPIVGPDGAVYATSKATSDNISGFAAADGAITSYTTNTTMNYISMAIGADGCLYGGSQGTSGSYYQFSKIDTSDGSVEQTAMSNQVMASPTIGPDKRAHFGSITAESTHAIEIGTTAAEGWSVRGGNLQGSSSLK